MDTYTNALHVNCTAVFYTAVAFLDLLDAGNKNRNVPQDSQILVTSSVAGFSRYLASSFAYSTSKAAVNHLVKMIATACAQNEFHIRCKRQFMPDFLLRPQLTQSIMSGNLIAPGLYPSEMTETTMGTLDRYSGIKGHEEDFADAHKMPTDRSPAERTGSEQDFAGTILFMASRAGAYLNGETLVSDGGRMSQLPATY